MITKRNLLCVKKESSMDLGHLLLYKPYKNIHGKNFMTIFVDLLKRDRVLRLKVQFPSLAFYLGNLVSGNCKLHTFLYLYFKTIIYDYYRILKPRKIFKKFKKNH